MSVWLGFRLESTAPKLRVPLKRNMNRSSRPPSVGLDVHLGGWYLCPAYLANTGKSVERLMAAKISLGYLAEQSFLEPRQHSKAASSFREGVFQARQNRAVAIAVKHSKTPNLTFTSVPVKLAETDR